MVRSDTACSFSAPFVGDGSRHLRQSTYVVGGFVAPCAETRTPPPMAVLAAVAASVNTPQQKNLWAKIECTREMPSPRSSHTPSRKTCGRLQFGRT